MTRPGMWALGVSRYLVAAWGFVRCLNGYMPAKPAGAFAVACVRQVGLEVRLLQVPYPVPQVAQACHCVHCSKVIISVTLLPAGVPASRVGKGLGGRRRVGRQVPACCAVEVKVGLELLLAPLLVYAQCIFEALAVWRAV